ncbi:DUF2255 family protein [Saccharomonospora sp. NPDC006951]
MLTWTTSELEHIGAADELHITTIRPDGSPRAWAPVWVVCAGDNLYVRSFRGTGGAWYRHAITHSLARIRVGGLDREVEVSRSGEAERAMVDAAYRTKYSVRGGAYLPGMLTDRAASATLLLRPRGDRHDSGDAAPDT